MSAPVQKFDSKTIGEHEANEVSEAMRTEAFNAVADAGLPAGFELTKVLSRTKVGRFIAASGVSGHVVAQGVWYQQILEKAAEKLSKRMTEEQTVEQDCACAGGIRDLSLAAAAMAQTQLKAVEITAVSSRVKSRKSQAPSVIVTGNNPQMVIQHSNIASPEVKH